ncbi:MAG: DUF4492 domain-containing protein [Rikenellaceae bacterium]
MSILKRILYFYIDGFRDMKVGKKLWLLIAIKLFIMFVVLKLFFFRSKTPDFNSSSEEAIYYREQFTKLNKKL